MDKYEYRLKTDHIKQVAARKDYREAAKLCDSIDWSKVRDVKMLTTVSDIYTALHRYEDAMNVLVQAYEYAPIGRRIVYRLTELALAANNYDDAKAYFEEFCNIAPHDQGRLVLLYKMACSQNATVKEKITILEAYKREDFDEKWAYELATLYAQSGQTEKCVQLCDDIVLWFGLGAYVERALELKERFAPLTEEQRAKAQELKNQKEQAQYEERSRQIDSIKGVPDTVKELRVDSELDRVGKATAEMVRSMEKESGQGPRTDVDASVLQQFKRAPMVTVTRLDDPDPVEVQRSRENVNGKSRQFNRLVSASVPEAMDDTRREEFVGKLARHRRQAKEEFNATQAKIPQGPVSGEAVEQFMKESAEENAKRQQIHADIAPTRTDLGDGLGATRTDVWDEKEAQRKAAMIAGARTADYGEEFAEAIEIAVSRAEEDAGKQKADAPEQEAREISAEAREAHRDEPQAPDMEGGPQYVDAVEPDAENFVTFDGLGEVPEQVSMESAGIADEIPEEDIRDIPTAEIFVEAEGSMEEENDTEDSGTGREKELEEPVEGVEGVYVARQAGEEFPRMAENSRRIADEEAYAEVPENGDDIADSEAEYDDESEYDDEADRFDEDSDKAEGYAGDAEEDYEAYNDGKAGKADSVSAANAEAEGDDDMAGEASVEDMMDQEYQDYIREGGYRQAEEDESAGGDDDDPEAEAYGYEDEAEPEPEGDESEYEYDDESEDEESEYDEDDEPEDEESGYEYEDESEEDESEYEYEDEPEEDESEYAEDDEPEEEESRYEYEDEPEEDESEYAEDDEPEDSESGYEYEDESEEDESEYAEDDEPEDTESGYEYEDEPEEDESEYTEDDEPEDDESEYEDESEENESEYAEDDEPEDDESEYEDESEENESEYTEDEEPEADESGYESEDESEEDGSEYAEDEEPEDDESGYEDEPEKGRSGKGDSSYGDRRKKETARRVKKELEGIGKSTSGILPTGVLRVNPENLASTWHFSVSVPAGENQMEAAMSYLRRVAAKASRTVPRQVARVTGKQLNSKDLLQSFERLLGKTIVVLEAGEIEQRVIEDLCEVLDPSDRSLLMVLVDQDYRLDAMFEKYPKLQRIFETRFVEEQITAAELQAYAREFAERQDSILDKTAELYLIGQIEKILKNPEKNKKQMVDALLRRAITAADRKKSGFGSFFESKHDKNGRLILRDKHFK